MKRPSLKEVKEHFKNALVVADAYTEEEFNIEEYDFNTIESGDSGYVKDDYIIYGKKDRDYDKILYDGKKGYAKIVTYKKPIRTNKLTELEKRVEVLESKIKKDDSVINIPGLKPSDFKINILSGEKENHLSDAFSYLFNPVNPIGENIRLKARIEELEAENKAILAGNSVKLEVGKWYKYIDYEKWNLCINNIDYESKTVKGFGFAADGTWMENALNDNWDFEELEKIVEMTESEVFEALKNEAVKRGFVSGTWISWKNEGKGQIKGDIYWASGSDCIAVRCDAKITDRENKNFPIFKDGIWAEIIPSISKSEAEKQLGKKIID